MGVMIYEKKTRKIRAVMVGSIRVMMVEGERWGVVCMVDRVGLVYLSIIIRERLGGERRVAI